MRVTIERSEAGHRLIPIKFWVSSGVRSHHFRVRPEANRPVEFLRQADGRLARVPRAVALQFEDGSVVHRLLVAEAADPSIFTAFLALASVDDETDRVRRYIAVHSAYEALVPARDLDCSALRHALSHPPHLLKHPPTVASLKRRFGDVSIDLSLYTHRKEFYRCLGAMLIAIDLAATARILGRWWAWAKEAQPVQVPKPSRQLSLRAG